MNFENGVAWRGGWLSSSRVESDEAEVWKDECGCQE